MRSCVPILLLAWLGLPRGGHAEEQVPCYSCRTSECPDLDAPPCAGARVRPPRVRPPKPRHDPAPAAPPRQEPPPAVAAPPSSPQAPPRAVPVEPPSPPAPATPPPPGAATPPPPGAATPPPAGAVKPPPPGQPPVSVQPPPERSLRRAALGVGIPGLLLAAGGAVLLGLDRRFAPADECWQPGDLSTCPQLYSTTAPGAALLAVGGGALIGAVVLFAVDARRASRPRTALRLPVPAGPFAFSAAAP